MTHDQPTIIFLHGLNTFADSLLHLGPVTLGRMDVHVKREFQKLGARFISIDGIGFGSPEDQATIVTRKLATRDEIPESTTVYLLGNSMGGLISRVVAHRLKTKSDENPKKLKVGGLISWGTPHHGARAADLALALSADNPRLAKSIAALGYDLKKNFSTYRHYSTESLAKFNERYPVDSAAAEHAFLCAVSARRSSPYFWSLYGVLHGLPFGEFTRRLFNSQDTEMPSDGFVSVESQRWGAIHGPYALDHFAQSGFSQILPTPTQRTKARKEFEKICRDMYLVMNPLMKP